MIYRNTIYIFSKRKLVIQLVLVAFLFMVNNHKVSAQQSPHYTQYYYNMQVLNPAFVGVNADLSVSVLSRQQWVGVEGAPKTSTFSVNGRIRNGLGLGVTAIHDRIGLNESTNINFDASYTLATSLNGRVSLGLKGGITYYDNKLSEGITPDNEQYASTSGNFPNIGFGALYYNPKFYAGISVPNFLRYSPFRNSDNFIENNYLSNINCFITSGAVFEMSENIRFKPSAIFKYTPTLPISFDVNANFIFKNQFETGLSYRYNESLSAMVTLFLSEKLKIGYAYDYQLGILGDNLSSHEIVLRFDLNLNRSRRWILHNFCCF